MKVDLRIIIGVCVTIIILLLIHAMNIVDQFDRSLYGMWSADDEYKQKAGLDALFLFISPLGKSNNCAITIFGINCNVYVMIKSNGSTKHNGIVVTKITRSSLIPSGIISYDMDFGKQIDIIPQHVSAQYDPTTSMLVLHSNERMFARLFKKPEPSFYCRAQEKLKEEEFDKEYDAESDVEDDAEDTLDDGASTVIEEIDDVNENSIVTEDDVD